jgi:3-mercaptopyruvate sulfurtransferase SseA
MVSILASSVVDREFKPWSGQTKDYKIGICCFSAKHAAVTIYIFETFSASQTQPNRYVGVWTLDGRDQMSQLDFGV